MSALSNCCQSLCKSHTPTQRTPWEIFKGTDGTCADPGTQNFPCHGGGAAGGQGHSLFSSN